MPARCSAARIGILSSFVVMLPALGTSPMAQERPSSVRSGFDVASVKPRPSEPGGSPSLTIGPDSLLATNYPLWALINQAYGVTSRQVERLPGWAQTERFDIRARSERPSTRAELLDIGSSPSGVRSRPPYAPCRRSASDPRCTIVHLGDVQGLDPIPAEARRAAEHHGGRTSRWRLHLV